jgi:curved DNA-binding protein CbpA
MSFVDYYAVLNVSREATEQEISEAFFTIFDEGASPAFFGLASEAHDILSNMNKRSEYDKTLGYLLVIQTEPDMYLSGMVYHLNKPDQAHLKLQAIIDEFKSWVVSKTSFEWEEAQHENYDYDLHADNDVPYVVLKFSRESDLASFADKLKTQKRIKS